MKFEWDVAKAEANRKKHGISFEEASSFEFDTAIIYIDDRDGYGEERLVAFGFIGSRVCCLVYSERRDSIRVISLRRATKKEAELYVEAIEEGW